MYKRIALVRKECKVTQTDLAEACGLTKNFISLIESGKREPSDRTVKDICRVLNVNETWLRTGEGEMFLPESRDDEIARFTATLLKEESDSFKNRLVATLAKMSEDEWEMLERKMREILGEQKE